MDLSSKIALMFVIAAVFYTAVGVFVGVWYAKKEDDVEWKKEFEEAISPELTPEQINKWLSLDPELPPRAIKYPQRKPKSKHMPTWVQARHNGWNQALDEVERLNR